MVESVFRKTLHAVLPLALEGSRDGDDLTRAITQGRTLRHFFQRDQRLCVNVAGRAEELPAIKAALQPLEDDWLHYRFVDEAALGAVIERSPVDGWYKQQVIKMSAPEWLDAPFWLTLDADVVCTKPFGIEDVLPGGRGLLDVDDVQDTDIYLQWAWASREVLGMAMPPLPIATTITPLIYAAPIMRACHQAIEMLHGRPWKDVLLDPVLVGDQVKRFGFSWTENHLYHAVATRTGMLRHYHALHRIDTPQRLIAGGIWRSQDWHDWDPAPAFDRARPGFFSVCSSYTGMPAEVAASKIVPFMAAAEPEKPSPQLATGLLDDDVEKTLVAANFRGRLLGRRPLVLLGPHDQWDDTWGNVLQRGVLEPLRERPAVIIVTLPWTYETVDGCKMVAARIARRQRAAPLHRFIVMGNTEIEVELFRQLGVNAALVSHNALLDERPFLTDSTLPVEFDAVYNAGFHPAKRHLLAAEIKSLALISAYWYDLPEFADHIAQVREKLAHAANLNLQGEDGGYRFLDRRQLCVQLQRCRVGLCLSDVEGSMRASAEYQFAGLPIVSTFSRGGRDQFFDDEFCAVVPPSPRLIADAVRELAQRKIPRRTVRLRTLHKVAMHRERFMQMVLQAIASLGWSERPDVQWPWLGEERRFTVAELHQELGTAAAAAPRR